MVRDERLPRTFAALIALTAWTGLILQFEASVTQHPSIVAAFWDMARFFTMITNAALAVTFTGIASGTPCCTHPRALTGLTLSILLVGIVYNLLLQGTDTLVGHEVQANILLHRAAPTLALIYWFACVRKGHLGHRDPLLWSIYPIAYLAYALARAAAGDGYAYPFIDPAGQGWSGVAVTVTGIALGFMGAGYALFWIDRKLATGGRSNAVTGVPSYSPGGR